LTWPCTDIIDCTWLKSPAEADDPVLLEPELPVEPEVDVPEVLPELPDPLVVPVPVVPDWAQAVPRPSDKNRSNFRRLL
jgi:hypothetical protein